MTLHIFQSRRTPGLFAFTVDPEGANLPEDGSWEHAGDAIPLGVTMAFTSAEARDKIDQIGYALVKGHSILPPEVDRKRSVP